MANLHQSQPRPYGVVISPRGVVSRAVAGDDLVIAGQCPNRCGPMVASAEGQRCTRCGCSTNVVPRLWRLA